MTQIHEASKEEILNHIIKVGEFLDRIKTPVTIIPVRNKEVLRIIKKHIGLDESSKESDQHD